MNHRLAAVAVVVPLSLLCASCHANPHQACADAVRREYQDADRVLQQPSDLNAFCASWNDQPPGISP